MKKNLQLLSVFLILTQHFCLLANAQMRQVYLDNIEPDNEIYKISFYSPSEGYAGFRDWIGFTNDSGRTFTKKYITLGNVDYNGYGVNLTFGFGINGVKAFNQNTIIAYGDYGLVPSILYSTNGGTTFKLIYHSQYNPLQLRTGITDMIFPQNNSTGYAVDADRVLKTTDQGLTWTMVRNDAGSYFDYLEAVDNSIVFALSLVSNKLIKTTNAGISWQQVTLPPGSFKYAHFLSSSMGWVNMVDNNSKGNFYSTLNGGGSWTLQNNTEITPFECGKMKFINDSTGYALSGFYVYKTTNGGKIWEPLPRDNNFSYLGYYHNDLHFWSNDQLWAGGGHGFLEINTNGGGAPMPRAFFKIDTANLSVTNNVNLINYSRPVYEYKWYKNDTLFSTTYDASYIHNIYQLHDTIKLIVSNGFYSDTAIHFVDFNPPVIVSSFTPTTGGSGASITINGINFSGATSVSFGGSPAGFTVVSSTKIMATVGAGASGNVTVNTPLGSGSLPGFIFIPPPTITSFIPTAAITGETVTITGTNFTGASAVTFGGVAASAFTVISSTTITAVVPSGPSGFVTVTALGGTGFLAGYLALPRIISFTPTSGTYGTHLNITGTSLNEVTTVTVGGISAQSFTINSSNSITAIVNPGGTGDVIVTKPGGSSTLAGFTWFPPPTITSFTPASGPVGTTVIITGTNFHVTPANNTVYFGSVKATVSAGTTTSLTVTVPVSATFLPINVTSNNLTAYSRQPFLVTFPGGGAITNNSFPVRTNISAGTGYTPHDLSIGDLDGDGKLDLALINFGPFVIDNAVSILRNTSSGTTVSFDPKIDFLVKEPMSVAIGDLDGDGKLDFAVTNTDNSTVGVYRNTSAPGIISFAAPVNLPTLPGPNGIVIEDIDGDGKPDISITAGGLCVYRNIGDPGNIAFASRVNYPFSGGNLIVSDMDTDGKPDLLASSWNSNNINILRNTSTKGIVSFAPLINITAPAPYYIVSGDIDGDGKPDLASSDITGSKAVVFRNTGSTGNINFASPVEFAAGYETSGIALSDLDGDGKLDIAVSQIDYNLSVLKNTSSVGTVTFAPKLDYAPGQFLGDNVLAIGDMNGDGKPDPVVVAEMRRAVSVFINNVTPEPFINSFTPSIGIEGTVVTITGNNFTGTTAVSFGGVPASSFIVNSSTSITANVGTGASGNISVTNGYGTGIYPGFAFGFPPVITSFTPASGTVGSIITITGTGFSPVIANNTVYFGGVKTTVTSASTTTLTVIVPTGSTPQPISVTANNLTAYSAKPFIITFPGATGSFSAGSFAARFDRGNGGTGSVSDIDGDGKLDLILSRAGGISIGRNTGTTGSLAFAPNINFATAAGSSKNVAADMDGDGKLDVVVVNYNVNSISVLRNTSAVGAVSFAPKIDYSLGIDTRPSGMAVGDLDSDGKPDVVVSNYYSHTVSVFRNLSTNGIISFDTRVDYAVDSYPNNVALGDIDGDGKPEMLVSDNGSPSEVSIFRNTSIFGTISFAPKLDFAMDSAPLHVQVGDLDGDDRMDMLIANGISAYLSIYRNTSSPGIISFAAKQDFVTGGLPNFINIGDIDGDGKQDIEVRNYQSISIFKNTSTTGSITLSTKYDYAMSGDPFGSSLGDIDGDGLPDVVVFVLGGTTSILRNLIGSVISVPLCPGGNSSLTSNSTGTTYQWLQNTGSGFANISDNTNFSGTTTVTLQLINIPSTWNGYEYRCIVNGAQSSSIYKIVVNGTVVTPDVTIVASSNAICAGTNVLFTATQVNGGTTPSYQWQVNGVNAGGNSNTYNSTGLTSTDQVKVILTSNAACPSPVTDTSNIITITVSPAVVSSVSITQSPLIICPGVTVIFTAVPVNGGNTPSYQWTKNGINTGTNNAVYTDSLLYTGDTINVIMTSNATCAIPATPRSNTLTINLSGFITPAITIAGTTIVNQGQETILTSSVMNGGAAPIYQWQDSSGTNNWQNINGATASTLNYMPLLTGNKVRCRFTSNAPCANPSTVTSEALTFTVGSGGRITPNPVKDKLTIEGLRLNDNWETMEIVSINGGNKLMSITITNQTRVSIRVDHLSSGLYVAILKRKSGSPVYLKFIKL